MQYKCLLLTTLGLSASALAAPKPKLTIVSHQGVGCPADTLQAELNTGSNGFLLAFHGQPDIFKIKTTAAGVPMEVNCEVEATLEVDRPYCLRLDAFQSMVYGVRTQPVRETISASVASADKLYTTAPQNLPWHDTHWSFEAPLKSGDDSYFSCQPIHKLRFNISLKSNDTALGSKPMSAQLLLWSYTFQMQRLGPLHLPLIQN